MTLLTLAMPPSLTLAMAFLSKKKLKTEQGKKKLKKGKKI